MRALVACLAVAAVLTAPAAADRFRTVLVGGQPDWAAAGGDQGCDICGGGGGHSGGGYRTSSSHSSRYTSSGQLAPRYRPGLLGRSGGGQRRTYHFSSEESEYTFSNGTHSTTITSKRSSEGVPQFHLRMTRLADGAVIESTVLSEAEYRQRRASLGLTGSDGSFGFESLGGGELHGLSSRRLSGEELLTEMERRLAHRRGGHGRHSTTSFSSEESHYSFSNGTHTTSITGRRNSEGVREYGLELIRDADGAVLDRATISEAEYNRRRQNMVGGRGFDDVFDIHGVRGSGARFDSRFDSRSDSRSRSHSEFGSDSAESEYGSRSGGRRPTHSGSSGSRSTSYFREERTETRREEGAESCACVSRSRCLYSDRVVSAAALSRCRTDEVCCREQRPLLPRVPTDYPRPAPTERPVRRPQAEPQVREEPACNCVPRDTCSYRERDFSLAGLQKCRRPMVCCKRQLVSQPAEEPAPLLPTPAPVPRHTTPDPAFVQRERDLFRDIVQHVDTDERAPVQRPVDLRGLQSSLSRYDDARDVSGGHRRTEVSRTEHSRTETSGAAPLPAVTGGQTSSTRQYSYRSRSSSGEQLPEPADPRRPLYPADSSAGHSRRTHSYERTSSGYRGAGADLLSGAHGSGYTDKEDSAEQSGSRVISSRRHYSERRVVSGEDSGEQATTGGYPRYPDRPVDLPGPQLGSSSSSRHYSYRSSSSSTSSGEQGDAALLAGGAGLRGQHSAQRPEVTSSSRRYSAQHSTSSGGGGGAGLLAGGDAGLSGGESVTSSRHYSERRVVSGDAGGDLGLSGGDLGLAGGSSGGYSSGSSYRSSSSWSSRSESGSSGGLVPSGGGSHQYPAGSAGGSGSSYRYSSSSHSSQAAPLESGSSYWSSYSQQSQRHRRGWTDLFTGRDETPRAAAEAGDSCVCVRFDRCSDGNLLHHGADLLDFSIGSRKQCSGFRVCCDTPPEVLRQLESTPGLRPGVVTSVPTAELELAGRSSPLAPHVSSSQPCVCVSSYLCQGGQIGASQQLLVDMRQVSQTGRCSYDGQVCCAVPWAQVQPTTPPAPCSCVPGNQCRQQDILTRYTNVNAPTCPGTQVCCSRPQSGGPAVRPPASSLDRIEYDMYRFCKSYPLSVACSSTHQFNVLPTLRPTPYFDAERDARALNDAFGLFGVDDDVLIGILTKRTFKERALIKQAFARLTGSNLADKIERYSTGNYEDLMVELLDGASMEEYLAKRLHEGMDRLGTDEDVVLETLISSTNQEIAAIKPYFYAESGHTLEDDIADDFSGDLEDILVALANGTRDNSFTVDRRRAREQAAALRSAGEGLGTSEETFKYYLTHENYAQLALIFSEYEQLAGETFEDALEDEFSRHTEDAVLAIVEVTRNLPAYFAGRLYDALWGRGVISKDDSSLRRIIISRAERDLGSIAQEYQRRYGNSLKDDIETKSTSDYEDALVSLIGG
ncbi:uncharacterized protein LOC122371205 [Amphibalanus amphitrite]|uniref:uncharacterized protein LOC122371205 n=1 Tax=Amphibalanus amphitrite TaxID=1232801 RepID=UPI001C90B241|nr:uncharacterized protein LOC122371205 [Amphibalanus amphitrite]